MEDRAHQIILDIYRTGKVFDRSGKAHTLVGAIDQDEGQFLQRLVRENEIRRTIEIGCAYGLSSLYICEALSGKRSPHHTIIDPHQSTEWSGVGTYHLERAGFGFFELIERPSELALPELVREGLRFDLALIDGWHTFDQVLLDFYFLDRLVRAGGIIVFDDVEWPSVNKAIRYLSNYPNYMLIGGANRTRSRKRRWLNTGKLALRPLTRLLPGRLAKEFFDDSVIRLDSELGLDTSMLALRKVAAGGRSYDWYVPF